MDEVIDATPYQCRNQTLLRMVQYQPKNSYHSKFMNVVNECLVTDRRHTGMVLGMALPLQVPLLLTLMGI